VPVYGGEAVLAGGEVVGRLRSAGYGFTVARTIGLAYLPAEAEIGAPLELEALGERVEAVVAGDALVDPENERILA
jgi:4-methylaminobutanoate oxidase (formaldehyde-forming)